MLLLFILLMLVMLLGSILEHRARDGTANASDDAVMANLVPTVSSRRTTGDGAQETTVAIVTWHIVWPWWILTAEVS